MKTGLELIKDVVKDITIYKSNYGQADQLWDVVVFSHGTCVIFLHDSLSDKILIKQAEKELAEVYSNKDHYCIESFENMLLIRYSNKKVINILRNLFIIKNKDLINKLYLIKIGHKEKDVGQVNRMKEALFGRSFMFKDGKNPKVAGIIYKVGY